MKVQFGGKTIDLDAVAAKRAAGKPLSLNEMMAFRGDGTPVATDSFTLKFTKQVDARTEVLKLALELQQADPKLTEQSAFIAALDSNKELAARYRAEPPGAHLPVDQRVTKHERRPAHARDEVLAVAAKLREQRQTLTEQQAFIAALD